MDQRSGADPGFGFGSVGQPTVILGRTKRGGTAL